MVQGQGFAQQLLNLHKEYVKRNSIRDKKDDVENRKGDVKDHEFTPKPKSEVTKPAALLNLKTNVGTVTMLNGL
jgi:hypothetical protein